jgi:hypothetical protein
VIATPPLFVGAENARLICVFSAVATSEVGASGTVDADTNVIVVLFEAVPSPAELIAFIFIVYETSLVNPDINKGEVDCAGLAVIYVEPPSIEYA